jgi:hypothetical protein
MYQSSSFLSKDIDDAYFLFLTNINKVIKVESADYPEYHMLTSCNEIRGIDISYFFLEVYEQTNAYLLFVVIYDNKCYFLCGTKDEIIFEEVIPIFEIELDISGLKPIFKRNNEELQIVKKRMFPLNNMISAGYSKSDLKKVKKELDKIIKKARKPSLDLKIE